MEPNQAALEHFETGLAHYKAGRFARSAAVFRKALKEAPDWPVAYHNLGRALEGMGNEAAALEAYNDALRCNPRFAYGLNALAQWHARNGQPEEAVAVYHRLLACVEKGIEYAHYDFAITLAKQGRVEEALHHYREAIRINPGYAPAHYNQGYLHEKRGDWHEAAASFRAALHTDADHQNAKYMLATVLVKLERVEQASLLFEEYLETNYRDGPAWMYLGVCYLQRAVGGESELVDKAKYSFIRGVLIRPWHLLCYICFLECVAFKLKIRMDKKKI